MPKTKVAILYGGRSVEHGVSINSARNIYQYLNKKLYQPYAIGISKKGKWYLTDGIDKQVEKGKPIALILDSAKPSFLVLKDQKKFSVDVIFPVLHGTDGEDGSIQGMIKAMDIPMVGTGVLGSAMAMNKIIAKKMLNDAGIPVSAFVTFRYADREKISFASLSKRFGLPFMVKAANLGSSVGVTKVKTKADFATALEEAFKYDNEILVEQYVNGREIECAILGNFPAEASNPGEIVISKAYEFYTFDAKYVDPDAVQIHVPAKLAKPIAEKIRKASVAAFEALHCEDFARVDLFLDAEGNIFINEINTIPGFTNSSMYPMMWKEKGIAFTDLISKLITIAAERYKEGKRTTTEFESSLQF